MTATAEQHALIRDYFHDMNEGSVIRQIIRLFDDFERAAERLALPGNDQWHEGREHIKAAKICFARSLADAILTGDDLR